MANIFTLYQRRDDVARYNQALVDGVAFAELRDVTSTIDAAFRQIKDSFPPGLQYDGCFFATPSKEIERSVIRGQKTSANRLKLDKDTSYMLELRFSYNGVPRASGYTRVPYVIRGNETHISGKLYHILGVLIDTGVNLSGDSMYVHLNRANYKYQRQPHVIVRNGIELMDNALIARLHQQADRTRKNNQTRGENRISAVPNIFLYLMMDKGFTAAAKHYFGVDVIVGEGTAEQLREQYPFGQYDIFSSTNSRPSGIRKSKWRDVTNLHLIFKEEDNHVSQEIATNFFYLLDHFPSIITHQTLEDTETWKVVGGHFIFNTEETSAKLVEKVNDHLNRSIAPLIDHGTHRDLKQDGIVVNDMYELIAWLIMNEKRTFREKTVTSMENKRITSSRYVLSYITNAITEFSYAMELLKNQPNITPKKIDDSIRQSLKESLFRSLMKNHPEVRYTDVSVDNIFASTRMIVAQDRANVTGKKAGEQMYKPENVADSSMLLITQFAGLPKNDPTGRAYISPYVGLGAGGALVEDDKYRRAKENLKKDLGR